MLWPGCGMDPAVTWIHASLGWRDREEHLGSSLTKIRRWADDWDMLEFEG